MTSSSNGEGLGNQTSGRRPRITNGFDIHDLVQGGKSYQYSFTHWTLNDVGKKVVWAGKKQVSATIAGIGVAIVVFP